MKECLYTLANPQSTIETNTATEHTRGHAVSFLQMLVAVKFSTCINTGIKTVEDDTGSTF